MPSRSAITKLQSLSLMYIIILSLVLSYAAYLKTLPPPPKPAEFRLTDMQVFNGFANSSEAGIGEPVTISVKVANVGEKAGSYTINLTIDGAVEQTRNVTLEGGASTTVEFVITKNKGGSYAVQIYSLTGTFKIKAPPSLTHTLKVESTNLKFGGYPLSGVIFTLDGENHETPYSATLNAGTHTISMTEEYQTGYYRYRFFNWEDGSKALTRTVNLLKDVSIVANYDQVASCPWLYTWNGNGYSFVAELSGSGYLGYFDRSREPPAFNKPFPWDYVKLDRTQLRLKNGYYDMVMSQVTDEIIYLDAAWLLVVDHSPDVNVFSMAGTEFTDPNLLGKIYTVSKNPLMPISCVNEKGEDCLSHISKLDGVCTSSEFGKWQYLELNLGDLSNAKEIKLIVNGYTDWFKGWEAEWAKLVQHPGFKGTVYPYMEVKDKNGNWMRVPKSRDIPELRDTARTFVVDLTGLFPTNDYTIRINYFVKEYFDFIGVDTTSQQDVATHRLDPVFADLHQILKTQSASTGNFTRYGDVVPLLIGVDDKFVIMRQGDEVSLKIPQTAPPPENMERDCFLYVCLWYKKVGNPAYKFAVDPLPFYNMNAFPYPPAESYPYDEEHLRYLREYNTRIIRAAS